MGGIDLFRFLDFQRRRKEALLAAVSDNGLQKLLAEKNGPRYAKAWVWMQPYDHAASDACCGFAPYHFWTNGRIGVWFLDYIAACREALRDTPSHHVITKPALVGAAIAKASTCAHYPAQTAINELDEFIGRLQASMKSNVAQVSRSQLIVLFGSHLTCYPDQIGMVNTGDPVWARHTHHRAAAHHDSNRSVTARRIISSVSCRTARGKLSVRPRLSFPNRRSTMFSSTHCEHRPGFPA
jgi:hypothetical protein